MAYRNHEWYLDPTAYLAIRNVVRGKYKMSRINKLIRTAKRLIQSKNIEYDFSKLTNKDLAELVDGIENGSISEARLLEILEPIRIDT